MSVVYFNGELKPAAVPLITLQNRSYKWGDGLFETMRILDGRILLAPYHFERLFSGMRLLMINGDELSTRKLEHQITELCAFNNCLPSARVRLAVYRNDRGGAGYSIEAVALSAGRPEWNDTGYITGLYPLARKGCDVFANLKTANYLPYVLADLYAQQHGLDECLLLNSRNAVCDGSKTNVFLITGTVITTPSLEQGCVQGVMRRFVIEELEKLGHVIHQQEVTEKMLLQADEIFLTSAIQGIKWVSRFRDKTYSSASTYRIYSSLLKTI
jgi:branched-chain amino acid aminotransferase